MRLRRSVLLSVAVFSLGVPAVAYAQTGQTAQIPLQFDYLNPGARSLGLGSAFIAVADDATAAYTNPAGLTQIVWPEASIELRYRRLDTRFLAGGRLSGTVTNNGIDTISGPRYDSSVDAAFRPYFISFVYPKGRWSVAGYRHELVLQNNDFLSEGPFQETISLGQPNNNLRNPGLAGDRTVKIDNYAGAVAYRVSDKLSLGFGVSAMHFELTSDFGSMRQLIPPFSASDPSTKGFDSSTTQTSAQTKFGFNAGVYAQVHRLVHAGFVIRQSVGFDFDQTINVFGSNPINKSGTFNAPMAIGAGVRIHSAENPFSVAIDYARVRYSRLTEDFITFQVAASAIDRVSIADANELHVGVEYRLLKVRHTPSIKGGMWFDPAHTVQYESDGSNSTEDVRFKAIFPGGEDLWHYCFGFGVPFTREFEFNLGADLTKQRRYVAASVVVRFHR